MINIKYNQSEQIYDNDKHTFVFFVLKDFIVKNQQKQKITLHRKIIIVCTRNITSYKHNRTKKKKKKIPPAPNFPPPSPDK